MNLSPIVNLFRVLQKSSLILSLCCLTLLLSSCDGETQEDITTSDTNPAVQGEPLNTTPPESTDTTTPTGDQASLEAGSYCYRVAGDKLEAIAEFLVEPNQAVSGTLEATISDDANNYYTSYQQDFAGVIEDETLKASITTRIENDVQKSQETWTINQNQLSDGKQVTLKRADCEEIIAIRANGEQPTASEPAPTNSDNNSPSAEPTAKSPIRVQFPQGATETTLMGEVKGEQLQVYLVNAQEGQDMYLKISSKSGKALFDVEVDNGEVIEQQLGDYLDFTLPFSGDYIVTVYPDTDAATYDLLIRVK